MKSAPYSMGQDNRSARLVVDIAPVGFSVRRILDFNMALIFLFFTFPVWIVIGILVTIDSPGPIFYTQDRVGLNGRIFRIIKFRTMKNGAERSSGPVLATKDDARITGVGLFLRMTRLDEIPQLVNVLVGEMSLIGPRPERPHFVEMYTMEIPRYRDRLKLKPGITGLAQVENGYDGDIDDVKQKLRYDLAYFEAQASIWLNLSIVVKTFMVVFAGKGQ